MLFLSWLCIAAILSWGVARLVRTHALQRGIVDVPTDAKPGVHEKPIPLLGGAAVYGALTVLVLGVYFFSGVFDGSAILPKHIIGLVVGGGILMIGGYLDDRYRVTPAQQLIAPLAATALVIISGMGITFITNPFGGVVRLDGWVIDLIQTPTLHWKITVWADMFTFIWLMGMMYTTKLLDGLDGLASGVTFLATLVLFAVSLLAEAPQYDTALLALMFAGALLGFLLWNFYPAKIFLGEGGSLFVGYTLALLAIIAGAKVTATLMVMALPILDVVRIIIVRKFLRKKPISQGDFGHIHHAFLRRGFTHVQTVLVFYGITFILGAAVLALQMGVIRDANVVAQPLLTTREMRIGEQALINVEIADTPEKRRRGLSGREYLAPNTGMLFTFQKEDKHTFWMKEMHFPLDVLWIREGIVVAIEQNISPPKTLYETPQTFASPKPVDMVLEVHAGFIKRYDIMLGDTAFLTPVLFSKQMRHRVY